MTGAQTVPLKHLALINERSLPDGTDPDKAIRYIDIGAVGRGKLISKPESLYFRDAPSRARRVVREGDTIVSTVRTYLRAVWPVTGDVENLIVSTGFAVITPRQVDPRYLSWWVTADPFVEEVVARSVGVSYPAINASELGQLPVRLPALTEQRAISDYLDAETARIDTLISKKRHLIDLLTEKRTSLITQTVTRGLPPASASRQVFDELPIRRVFEVVNGGTPTSSEENWNGDVEWATPADLACAHGDILRATARTLTRTGLHQGSNSVPANSLIVSTRAPIGYVCETISRMAFNQGCRGLVPRCNVDLRFFRHQLSVMDEQLQALGQGSTFMELSTTTLASVLIAVPELHEQRAIADYLDAETARIDALSSRQESAITLLEERRTALITAAVTGDLAVPGLATETPTVRPISP